MAVRLFAAEGSALWDTVFNDTGTSLSSEAGQIRGLTQKEQAAFSDALWTYFAAKLGSTESLQREEELTAVCSEDGSKLELTLRNFENCPNVMFGVWSEDNGQDDIYWYQAEKKGDVWRFTVPLRCHNSKGVFYIHAYEGQQTPEIYLTNCSVYVDDYPPQHFTVGHRKTGCCR